MAPVDSAAGITSLPRTIRPAGPPSSDTPWPPWSSPLHIHFCPAAILQATVGIWSKYVGREGGRRERAGFPRPNSHGESYNPVSCTHLFRCLAPGIAIYGLFFWFSLEVSASFASSRSPWGIFWEAPGHAPISLAMPRVAFARVGGSLRNGCVFSYRPQVKWGQNEQFLWILACSHLLVQQAEHLGPCSQRPGLVWLLEEHPVLPSASASMPITFLSKWLWVQILMLFLTRDVAWARSSSRPKAEFPRL